VTARRRSAVVLSSLTLLVFAGCSGTGSSTASPAPAGGIGQDVGDIGHDLPIVKRAEAAASEVVRATGDCDAVKEALPRAQAVLDETLTQVRTGASRTTITNLKKQISDVAGACP
jgi:hypothetical protein